MRLGAIAVIGATCLFAQDQPSNASKGVHPRATPQDYWAQGKGVAATYGASLVPVKQVRQMFASDISKHYLVVEVACFPADTQAANLNPDDFVIKLGNAGDMTHNADPSAVAAASIKSHVPRIPIGEVGSDTQVRPVSEIGVERRTNPATGKTENGTYTRVGVEVTHGAGAEPTAGGGSDSRYEDRRRLEAQLRNRQLPSGRYDHPVAGYLYFPKSLVKQNAKGQYVLVYLGDATVELPISAKGR